MKRNQDKIGDSTRYFTKEYQAEVQRKLKDRLADPKTEDAVLQASPLLRLLRKKQGVL